MDYRDSHIAVDYGINYHKSWHENNYRHFIWSWEKKVLTKVVNKYVNDKSTKYLDFACGTARVLGFLEKKFTDSTGIDVSESMLNIAKLNTNKAKIIKADITRRNVFPQEAFGLITAFRFFLNAQASLRSEVLKELHYILKNDGILVFNIHMNKTCLTNLMANCYLKLKGIKQTHNALSIKEVRTMLKDTGFEIVDTFHYSIIPILIKEEKEFSFKNYQFFEDIFSHISLFKILSRYIIFIARKK